MRRTARGSIGVPRRRNRSPHVTTKLCVTDSCQITPTNRDQRCDASPSQRLVSGAATSADRPRPSRREIACWGSAPRGVTDLLPPTARHEPRLGSVTGQRTTGTHRNRRVPPGSRFGSTKPFRNPQARLRRACHAEGRGHDLTSTSPAAHPPPRRTPPRWRERGWSPSRSSRLIAWTPRLRS